MEPFNRFMKPSTLWCVIFFACTATFLYICFVGDWGEYLHDPNLAFWFLHVTVLGGTSVVFKCMTNISLCVLCKAWCVVRRRGCFRRVAFCVVVCTLCCILTALLYGPLIALWSFAEKSVVNTMEKNIVFVESQERVQMLTLLNNYDRRQGEDTRLMSCTFDVLWPADRRPSDHVLSNWTWSLDDKPLSWTPRHVFTVKWTELSESDVERMTRSREPWLKPNTGKTRWVTSNYLFGLTSYRVSLQLQVKHLQASDFGVYKCRVSDVTERSRRATHVRMAKVRHRYACQHMRLCGSRRKGSDKTFFERLWQWHVRDLRVEELLSLLKASWSLRWFRRDTFDVSETVVHARQLVLPPGAFVFIAASYWREGDKVTDTGVDFLINSRPAEGRVFSKRYCSWLLWIYFLLAEGTGRYINTMDTTVRIETESNGLEVTHQFYGFCLGPQTFGRWEAEARGWFYDYNEQRYELSSFLLPFSVAILPRRQTLFSDLFSGSDGNQTEPEAKENDRHRSLTDEDWRIYEELAQAVSLNFNHEEYLFIVIVPVIAVYLLRFFLWCLNKFGAFLKKKIFAPRPKDNLAPDNFANPYRHSRGTEDYHVFLSHSEMEAARIQEEVLRGVRVHRQRVFFPFQDIPPNKPILPATDRAIHNSRHFVIFFSEDYLEENMFEADRIVQCVMDRGQSLQDTVLVVKLDFTELPAWLNQCTIHDWTLFGQSNRLQLLNSWLGCGLSLWWFRFYLINLAFLGLFWHLLLLYLYVIAGRYVIAATFSFVVNVIVTILSLRLLWLSRKM